MDNEETKNELVEAVTNAIGIKEFDADAVVAALNYARQAGMPGERSISALMNALPHIAELAKRLY